MALKRLCDMLSQDTVNSVRAVCLAVLLLVWSKDGAEAGKPRRSVDDIVNGLQESEAWRVESGPWLQDFEYISQDAVS